MPVIPTNDAQLSLCTPFRQRPLFWLGQQEPQEEADLASVHIIVIFEPRCFGYAYISTHVITVKWTRVFISLARYIGRPFIGTRVCLAREKHNARGN